MLEPRISGIEIFTVEVNPLGNWMFIELQAGVGLTGIGEASHGYGFSKGSAFDDSVMRLHIEWLYQFIEGQSPFDIESFRVQAWEKVTKIGLAAVTAFSGLEQAMCDLAGKSEGVPIYQLLGGKIRDTIPVYANINRATTMRTPEAFAVNAEKAVLEGFRAVKIAPFDDLPPLNSDIGEIETALRTGITRVKATRKAIGEDIALMVDCHSKFNRNLGIQTAQFLTDMNLAWYEEPVAPDALQDTIAIHQSIPQRLAGGEILFGRKGFELLCRKHAVDVIMPDVKHCGGIFEAKRIALLGESCSIEISPHNPSGPVATAASAQLAATLNNFSILEYAWGEVSWRSTLTHPPERFQDGTLELTDNPGLGCHLSRETIEKYCG